MFIHVDPHTHMLFMHSSCMFVSLSFKRFQVDNLDRGRVGLQSDQGVPPTAPISLRRFWPTPFDVELNQEFSPSHWSEEHMQVYRFMDGDAADWKFKQRIALILAPTSMCKRIESGG